MADSVDVVLEFLRKNRFTKAEAALRGELSGWPDVDESSEKSLSKEKKEVREESRAATTSSQQDRGPQRSGDISQEFIVKDIEVGKSENGSDNKKGFGPNQDAGSNLSDLYPWSSSPINSNPIYNSKDSGSISNNFSELMISEQPKFWPGQLVLNKKIHVGTKPDFSSDQRSTYSGSNEKTDFKDRSMENPWSKREELSKECPVKTLFPLSSNNASTSYDDTPCSRDDRMERKKKPEHSDISETTKEPYDMGMPYISGVSQESLNQKNTRRFDLPLVEENHREGLPRLPPVRLKSIDKLVNMNWEEKSDLHGSGMMQSSADNAFLIGSFLDVPIGQDINTSGGKRTAGSSWLSVSQGIAEDTSDLVSGFATLGDDSADYPNEYWDSDEYDDDDDLGYMRQPIEDETWFLAHEIDYPSDNEKGTVHGSVLEQHGQVPRKDEDDDQSFAEEDSYLSGEQYLPGKHIRQVADENDLIAHYDGQLLDAEELNLMRAAPVWQGFVTQNNELPVIGNGKVGSDCERPQHDLIIDDDQHGSVRSVGVGINSDAADIGSEIRESLVGGSSEGDIEYYHEHGVGISGSRDYVHNITMSNFNRSNKDKKKTKQMSDKYLLDPDKSDCLPALNYTDAGFSFPPPHSKRSKPEAAAAANDDCEKSLGADDMLATWKRKSSDSSPIRCSRYEKVSDAVRSRSTSASSASNYAYDESILSSFFKKIKSLPVQNSQLFTTDPQMATRSLPILRRLLRSATAVTSPSPLGFRHRSITYMPRPGDGGSRTVTLIPGDGIGPLVTDAVQQVFAAMHAPIEFEAFEVHGDMSAVPAEVMDSIKRNKVCLKGGLATPVGGGVSSLNMQLRKELDLYASLVNCFNVPGLPSRHENVDIVVIRENTEGEYSGLEHEVVPGVVESLKVITKFCSERIAKYAFEYAYLNDRKKVTAVHKANIMKLADGLFLESCREIANNYPGIEYNEIIVDNCCMQLVSKPEQFDVMVTPNLYGNLVANTAAGIAGGTGVMPGGNVGQDYAIFEQGASAGNVGNEKLVEKKRANPTALLLSSAMMLRHLQFPSFADRLETAVMEVVEEGKYRTKDLGGKSTTQEVVDAVIAALD